MDKHPMSDSEILAQIPEARARAESAKYAEPHARSARYERRRGLLHVSLTNGADFSLPIDVIPGLASAADEELAPVEVGPHGISLHWEKLDADVSVAGLAQMLFGTRTLLRAAGASGGSSTSEAKVRAARLNGLKGGRPKAPRPVSAVRAGPSKPGASPHKRIAPAVREPDAGGAKNKVDKARPQSIGGAIGNKPAKKK